jgi:polysaccharide deacetylase family protein (PEP-CTERM system associated)
LARRANGPPGAPVRLLETLDELRPPSAGSPVGALTVDMEDWYQSCIDFDAPISDRVVRNTALLLEELDASGVRATFFVQGLVAVAYPDLVRELAAVGHEVQSHAHTHRPLDRMDPAELREEIERGKAAVEDAAGVEVTAFRAPDFTIGSENLWVLETLAELGFRVDSSIFPLRTRRYGIGGWELAPHRIELESGAEIVEAPVAVWSRGRVRLPVAGGGYVRLAPGALLEKGMRSIVASGRPPIVYCHPYEFNSEELADYRGRVPERFRRTQGLGRKAFVRRLRGLFRSMRFGRVDEVLAGWGVASVPRQRLHELPAEG